MELTYKTLADLQSEKEVILRQLDKINNKISECLSLLVFFPSSVFSIMEDTDLESVQKLASYKARLLKRKLELDETLSTLYYEINVCKVREFNYDFDLI
jgi:hypothetical protein